MALPNFQDILADLGRIASDFIDGAAPLFPPREPEKTATTIKKPNPVVLAEPCRLALPVGARLVKAMELRYDPATYLSLLPRDMTKEYFGQYLRPRAGMMGPSRVAENSSFALRMILDGNIDNFSLDGGNRIYYRSVTENHIFLCTITKIEADSTDSKYFPWFTGDGRSYLSDGTPTSNRIPSNVKDVGYDPVIIMRKVDNSGRPDPTFHMNEYREWLAVYTDNNTFSVYKCILEGVAPDIAKRSGLKHLQQMRITCYYLEDNKLHASETQLTITTTETQRPLWLIVEDGTLIKCSRCAFDFKSRLVYVPNIITRSPPPVPSTSDGKTFPAPGDTDKKYRRINVYNMDKLHYMYWYEQRNEHITIILANNYGDVIVYYGDLLHFLRTSNKEIMGLPSASTTADQLPMVFDLIKCISVPSVTELCVDSNGAIYFSATTRPGIGRLLDVIN